VINEQSQLIRIEDLRRFTAAHTCRRQDACALVGGVTGPTLSPPRLRRLRSRPGARTGLMALGAVEEVSALCAPDAMLTYARNPIPQATGTRSGSTMHDQHL